VGAVDVFLAGKAEAPLKYHPSRILFLTVYRDPVSGQRLLGSLTGAVASTAISNLGRSDGNIRGKPGCMLGSPWRNFVGFRLSVIRRVSDCSIQRYSPSIKKGS